MEDQERPTLPIRTVWDVEAGEYRDEGKGEMSDELLEWLLNDMIQAFGFTRRP